MAGHNYTADAACKVAYKCDESSGNLADSSANSNTGTASLLAYSSTVKVGTGVNFNNAASKVTIGNGASVNNLPATGFSFCCWTNFRSYLTGLGAACRVFDKGNLLLLTNNDGTYGNYFLFEYDWTSSNGFWSWVTPITDTSVHHICLTYDGSSTANVANLYIDGVLQAHTTALEQSPAGSRPDDSGNALYLGNRSDNIRGYDGTMDEVMFYNGVLSTSDITSIMQFGISNNCAYITPSALTISARAQPTQRSPTRITATLYAPTIIAAAIDITATPSALNITSTAVATGFTQIGLGPLVITATAQSVAPITPSPVTAFLIAQDPNVIAFPYVVLDRTTGGQIALQVNFGGQLQSIPTSGYTTQVEPVVCDMQGIFVNLPTLSIRARNHLSLSVGGKVVFVAPTLNINVIQPPLLQLNYYTIFVNDGQIGWELTSTVRNDAVTLRDINYTNPYYVDQTGGSDSSNGKSTTTAWKTINKVNNFAFQPGDTVLFKRGEAWAEQLTIAVNGTSTNYISFGSYGTGVKPKLNPSGTDRCIEFSRATYIKIDSFECDGRLILNDCIKVTDISPNNIISNCDCHNAPLQGILINGQSHNTVVYNCNIYNNGTNNSLHHGIYIESNNVIVEACTIYNNAAFGVQVYSDTPPDRAIVRYCTMYNNGSSGHGGGIVATGTNGSYYYNLLRNNVKGIYFEIAAANNTFYNNTVANNTVYGVVADDGSTSLTFRNNIIYGNTTNNWEDEASVGTVQDHNLIGVNPVFVSSIDYSLQTTSPAKNAGIDLGLVSDILGESLVGLPDIGAYEFGSSIAYSRFATTLVPFTYYTLAINNGSLYLANTIWNNVSLNTLTTAVYAPTVTGSATVLVGVNTITSSVYAPTISGAASKTVSKLNITSAVFGVTVTSGGSVIVQVGTLNITSATLVPTETGVALVVASLQTIASAVYAISISGTNLPGVLNITSAALAITGSSDVLISAGLRTISGSVYSVTITGNALVWSFDSPYGWWRFNEGSGTSTTADSSGNGFTGTLISSPTWAAGKLGYGLSFNGSSQYVTIGASNSYTFSTQVSLSAWVKTNSNNTQRVVSFNRGPASSCFMLGIGLDAGGNATNDGTPCGGFRNSLNQFTGIVGPTSINDGNWHHLAISINSGNAVLYVDGVSVGTSSNVDSTNTFTLSSDLAEIGNLSGSSGQLFSGVLDDVRLFNKALSATEAAGLSSIIDLPRIASAVYSTSLSTTVSVSRVNITSSALTIVIGGHVIVQPSVVNITSTVYSVTLASSITLSTLNITASVYAPTFANTALVLPSVVTIASSALTVSAGGVIVPSVVNITSVVYAVTFSGSVTVSVSAQNIVSATLAPSIAVTSTVTISASVQNIVSTALSPSELEGVTITPSVLTITSSANTATASADANKTVSLLTLTSAVYVVTVTGTASVLAGLNTIVATLLTVSLNIEDNVTIMSNALNVLSQVLAPVIRGDSNFASSVRNITSSVLSPTISGSALALVSALSSVVSLLAPTLDVHFNITLTPSFVNIVCSSPSAQVTISVLPNRLIIVSTANSVVTSTGTTISAVLAHIISKIVHIHEAVQVEGLIPRVVNHRIEPYIKYLPKITAYTFARIRIQSSDLPGSDRVGS